MRSVKLESPSYPNFLNKKDPAFSTFQVTLDNLYRSLSSDGVGVTSCHIESISSEEESDLCASGVLNIDTPKGLLRCVFYYNGKCFCLKVGQEHRYLEVSQLR